MALYGVVADIHGNREALETVLDYLERRGIRRLLCLGDIVGYNADPDECAAMVRTRGAVTIAGNHDLIGIGRLGFERCSNQAKYALKRTRRTLGRATAEWLATLPSTQLVEREVALVHGGVRDVQLYMKTEAQICENAAFLRTDLPGAKLCFFGHSHEQGIFEVDGETVRKVAVQENNLLNRNLLYFVNPGSVDASRKRSDKYAQCAILDTLDWSIELLRLRYDCAATEAKAAVFGYRIGKWTDRFYSLERRLLRFRRAPNASGGEAAARHGRFWGRPIWIVKRSTSPGGTNCARPASEPRFPAEAVVCVGDLGINGLATVRSLGRRAVRVHVVALQTSRQIASLSRYCSGETRVSDLGALHDTLCAWPANPARRALLFIDNDNMMKALAPHAAELQRRFQLVEPLGDALRLTDKSWQVRVARDCGLAVPRSWFPRAWEEIQSLKTRKRLIAKPLERADFKALTAANGGELAAALRRHIASPADVVVQEYVEGDDSHIYVALCYRARSANRCFVLSARKVRQTSPDAGIMAVGRVVDAPEVRRLTLRLVEALDYRGVIDVEFKRSPRDGKYYFIEWNARPPYFHSMGWKAGFDGAYFAYCDHVAPENLDSVRMRHDSGHYWINVHEDLRRLVRSPRLALRPGTWRPYLQAKEWAVFAFDDPKPWLRSMQQLTAWLWQLPVQAALRRMRRANAALGATGR